MCMACTNEVARAMAAGYCPRCGITTPPHGNLPAGCSACADTRFAFDGVIRMGAYAWGLQHALQAFKYGGREELDEYFARQLSRAVARSDVYESLDALLCVPTCWQHRLRRPFHPAEHLARRVARHTGIPYAPLLVRRGGGPHQVGQSFTARQRNVRGKFHLARGCAVQGARLCLVDDVMTTGATTGECARVLKRAGAAEVQVAVIARAGIDPATLRQV